MTTLLESIDLQEAMLALQIAFILTVLLDNFQCVKLCAVHFEYLPDSLALATLCRFKPVLKLYTPHLKVLVM